ncbi:tyrosinase family protein [Aspergillus aculeatinus CBS 121060]|uniref:Di-copper centre-containing protein n=1 Tax=Aspergillus aculeatinus CBS 121060 TaxID=1448322 RepID=A0ACD1H3X1_9EURO|nr:Di-copper centre-containing protein [Aspergillus aculeatinus CBS 121060]RAH68073.1 Di-copper centre-containing protein [Aspergillus aculeatinus CBS 121060]
MKGFIATAVTALPLATTTRATCESPSVRKSWSALTLDERAEYINSTLCLMNPVLAPAKTGTYGSKSRWDELLVAHVAQVQFIHVVGAFFPWHRWYTRVHENLLRDECGYTGPYPYWDEQEDQARAPLENASVWSTSPTAGFGTGNTDADGCVQDGPFAYLPLNLTTELTRTSDSCLKRVFNQTHFDSVSQTIVDSCMDIDDYWSMWACLGNTPHTGGHFGVGGTMEHVSFSAFDPIFFLHHTNLDRLWTQWQSKNASRLTAMGGPLVATQTLFGEAQPSFLGVSAFVPYFGDHGNVTTVNHTLWLAGLAENITVADAMDVSNEKICITYE